MIQRCHAVIEADWKLLQEMTPRLSLPRPDHSGRRRRGRAYYSSGRIVVWAVTRAHDRELMARRAAELCLKRANRSLWVEAMVLCVAKVAGTPIIETTSQEPRSAINETAPAILVSPSISKATPLPRVGTADFIQFTMPSAPIITATMIPMAPFAGPTPTTPGTSETPADTREHPREDAHEHPGGDADEHPDAEGGVFIPEPRWKSGQAP